MAANQPTNSRRYVFTYPYRKRALALVWSVRRGKKGWVAVRKQIALLKYVAELIPKGSEVWLLGGSELQHAPLIARRKDGTFPGVGHLRTISNRCTWRLRYKPIGAINNL